MDWLKQDGARDTVQGDDVGLLICLIRHMIFCIRGGVVDLARLRISDVVSRNRNSTALRLFGSLPYILDVR